VVWGVAEKTRQTGKKREETEAPGEGKSGESKGRESRPSNWIVLVAIVLLVLAVFLNYSAMRGALASSAPTATPAPAVEPSNVPLIEASPSPYVEPSQPPAGSTQPPVECKLFKNKYTSEFKCIACAIQAGTGTSKCIYTARDWTQVPSGTSGYYCQYDEILALKCKTLKALKA
jgi:hypothetical protein